MVDPRDLSGLAPLSRASVRRGTEAALTMRGVRHRGTAGMARDLNEKTRHGTSAAVTSSLALRHRWRRSRGPGPRGPLRHALGTNPRRRCVRASAHRGRTSRRRPGSPMTRASCSSAHSTLPLGARVPLVLGAGVDPRGNSTHAVGIFIGVRGRHVCCGWRPSSTSGGRANASPLREPHLGGRRLSVAGGPRPHSPRATRGCAHYRLRDQGRRPQWHRSRESVAGEVTGTHREALRRRNRHLLARCARARDLTQRHSVARAITASRSGAARPATTAPRHRQPHRGHREPPGGSGQYGNAVNVFRAGNVIVRGNRIGNCAFTAVRGNAASNLHVEGKSSSTCARSRSMPNSASRAR